MMWSLLWGPFYWFSSMLCFMHFSWRGHSCFWIPFNARVVVKGGPKTGHESLYGNVFSRPFWQTDWEVAESLLWPSKADTIEAQGKILKQEAYWEAPWLVGSRDSRGMRKLWGRGFGDNFSKRKAADSWREADAVRSCSGENMQWGFAFGEGG